LTNEWTCVTGIEDLSTTEKIELLDLLWESLNTDDLPLTEDQRRELDDRIARHERNPSDVIPWEQVKANLLKKP
jgi:putative addiction module component (TIGR02574 family)